MNSKFKKEERKIVRPAYDPMQHELTEEHMKWLTETRGIGLAHLKRHHVKSVKVWMPGVNAEVSAIAFPFTKGGEVVNVKYRTMDKRFRQEKDAEKTYFGMDFCNDESKSLVIVEGEMDVLAFNCAGIRNVVSVPDGAPREVQEVTPKPEDDRKFEYVWNCREFTDKYEKIYLATDMDEPGQALAEELSRRFGKVKCYKVNLPEKDANDVLLRHGSNVLVQSLRDAEPYPLAGSYRVADFVEGVFDILSGKVKLEGLSTGWKTVDRCMKIMPGMLSIVTGIPGSGKSQFVDALMLNMMREHDWRFGVCSFENDPKLHLIKLAHNLNAEHPAISSSDKAYVALEYLNNRMFFIRPGEDVPTIDWVLERAKELVFRYGIRGLVIDPYNEVAQDRANYESETEFVSKMLGKVKRFAQVYGVHVWFIAHPAKGVFSHGDKPGCPSLYDISGSAHWVNKADYGFVVHREFNEDNTRSDEAVVKVLKVRHSFTGEPGRATLRYDRKTGRYYDVFGS